MKTMTELVINTLQEAKQACFTGAVRGLRYQGWTLCTRTPGVVGCAMNQGKPGVHCAIGWLIPWAKQRPLSTGSYDSALDSGLLHPAVIAWYQQAPEGEYLRDFLAHLQWAHDCGRSDMMEGRYKKLGVKHHLKWPKE